MTAIKQITPEQALELMKNNSIKYIDVRSPAEFAAGHVPGSINIPAFLPSPETGGMMPCLDEFAAKIAESIPQEEELVIGCKMGGRSQAACDFLAQQGYKELNNLAGGFTAWKDNGLEVETE